MTQCDVMPSPYADAPERAEKALASPIRRVLLIMITRFDQCDVVSSVVADGERKAQTAGT